MGEPTLSGVFESESAFAAAAGAAATRWRSLGLAPLRVALRGDLGSGKSTWVRGMLRGLGFAGPVPSPTYTLLEHYPLAGLTVVHVDLYRLAGGEELEDLGIRDWLAEPDVWLLAEWPERAPGLGERCDLELEFRIEGPAARRLEARARSPAGTAALRALSESDFNNVI